MWLKWTAPLVLAAALIIVAGASAIAEKKTFEGKNTESPASPAVEAKKREKKSKRKEGSETKQTKEARRVAREHRKAKRENDKALAAVPYEGPAERVGVIEHAPVRESSG